MFVNELKGLVLESKSKEINAFYESEIKPLLSEIAKSGREIAKVLFSPEDYAKYNKDNFKNIMVSILESDGLEVLSHLQSENADELMLIVSWR